jgi:hypothetical protein
MTSATLHTRVVRFASLALTAVAVLSCTDRTPTTISSVDATSDYRYGLASITVTPNPATLAVGAAQAFTAVGRDFFGRPIAITPAWAVVAGGGSIHSSGQFTAGTAPGTYANTVRATYGSISGAATVTVTSGTLATITLAPNPVTLAAGTAQTFTAVGRDAGGNVVAIAPTWSVASGGGTISSSGVFTAGSVPGTYANSIKAATGAISGAATVTVTSGTLATVTVAPNPATLAVGATQSFTAVGRDAAGNVVAIAPTWSVAAGGGTINSAGLFTAGTLSGTYTNTVRASSGGIVGGATVTVTGPRIGLSLTALNYSAQAGGAAPAAQTLAVSNPGSGSLAWTATKVLGAAWLTLAPTSGTAPTTITSSIILSGLAAGAYRDTILIAAAGAANSPQKVPVSLTVTAPVGGPDATRSTLAVGAGTITAGTTTTLTLQAKDAGGVNITVGGASVTFGNSAGTSVITIGAVGDKGNGTYAATVTGVNPGAAAFSATLNGSAVTTPMPTITVSAASGGYATPNIVTNASFETGEGATGWSGFTNNSGGDPSPASGNGGFTVARSAEQAYGGTASVKSSFAANASDAAVAFTSPPFSQTTVYARVWFYRTGALPNTAHKWIRFQTAGLNGVRGGLYLSSANNDITWSEAVNSNIGVALGTGLPTANVWHSIEVQYDRSTWNVAGKGPRVRFWYDNVVRVGPSPTTYFGSGGTAYWGRDDGTPDVAGPWLYAGAADGSASPSAYLVFDDTYNGGNAQSGSFYYDRIAISSLGRIGP